MLYLIIRCQTFNSLCCLADFSFSALSLSHPAANYICQLTAEIPFPFLTHSQLQMLAAAEIPFTKFSLSCKPVQGFHCTPCLQEPTFQLVVFSVYRLWFWKYELCGMLQDLSCLFKFTFLHIHTIYRIGVNLFNFIDGAWILTRSSGSTEKHWKACGKVALPGEIRNIKNIA